MKTTISVFFLLFAFTNITLGQPEHVKVLKNGTRVIENFENEEIGTLPLRWFTQKGEVAVPEFSDELRAEFKYKILEENGNTFLRYAGTKAMHLNFPLLKVENLNIHETPILSWKWRVWDLPDGASEDDENDTAASIYVVFDLGQVLWREVPKSIRYTWSSSLPEGTVLSKFFGNQKVIVVESGKDGLGQWKTFQQNIVEDYKRLFGEAPPETPLAILILSDGDNTGSTAIADYDDIILKPIEN